MNTLVKLLQANLPADWTETDPFRMVNMFQAVPMYTALNLIEVGTSLRVGNDTVKVVAKSDCWFVYGQLNSLRADTESDLFECVIQTVAYVALSQNPIPTVPEWAIEETGKQRGRRIGECDDRISSLYDEIQGVQEDMERLRAYNPCVGS